MLFWGVLCFENLLTLDNCHISNHVYEKKLIALNIIYIKGKELHDRKNNLFLCECAILYMHILYTCIDYLTLL